MYSQRKFSWLKTRKKIVEFRENICALSRFFRQLVTKLLKMFFGRRQQLAKYPFGYIHSSVLRACADTRFLFRINTDLKLAGL